MALHTIEICAGVGMLGEGLRAGLAHMGHPLRTVAYLERETYPAACLAARIEEGSLDPAPVWSGLLTFNAGAWRGAVDGIVAGFPCQDLSLAGRRAGLDGKRSGLFFNILDIADACGAWFLFLENVAGIASATASVVDEAEGELEERAAARVVGELAERGWHAEWLTVSASEVGASHGRERWFCFARRELANAERLLTEQHERKSTRPSETASSRAPSQFAGCSGPLGNPDDQRTHGGGAGTEQNRSAEPENPGGHMGNPQSQRRGETRPSDPSAQHARFGGAEPSLANTTEHRRHQGRAEPSRQQGRLDAAECSGAMADASGPGQQGRELTRALPCNRGGASTWTN